jgi:hypothetical protein
MRRFDFRDLFRYFPSGDLSACIRPIGILLMRGRRGVVVSADFVLAAWLPTRAPGPTFNGWAEVDVVC